MTLIRRGCNLAITLPIAKSSSGHSFGVGACSAWPRHDVKVVIVIKDFDPTSAGGKRCPLTYDPHCWTTLVTIFVTYVQ